MRSFSLTKWYLDVVTGNGDVGTAYWGRVEGIGLRYAFSGVLLWPHGSDSARWRFAADPGPPPTPDAHGFRWQAASLAVEAEFVRREPPFTHRLLECADGLIDWRCEIPRADVRLRAGEAVLEGIGYAECLTLTILPWRLPADEIRWGRFLTGETSLVWIDWRGSHPQSFAFRNGQQLPVTSIADNATTFGCGIHLDLNDSRPIQADWLGGLLAPLEPLRQLAAPLARTHQTRWLSRGELRDVSGQPTHGWALHELVKRT